MVRIVESVVVPASLRNDPRVRRRAVWYSLLLIVTLAGVMAMGPVEAARTRLIPSLTVTETYTDNVSAASDGEARSSFVTSISPALSARRNTGRSSLNLDYRPELVIRHDTGSEDVFHSLVASARSELIRDVFFLNGTASARQVSRTTQGAIPLDNVTESDNRETAYSLQISPTYRGHVGTFFNTTAGLSLGQTHVSGNAASDSTQFGLNATASSGRYFRLFSWSVSASEQRTVRDQGEDVVSDQLNVILNYRLTSEVSLFSNLGYSGGDTGGASRREDGVYMTLGASWQVTPRLFTSVELGANRYGYSLRWVPSNRTNFTFDYLHTDVGINEGDRFSLAFSHASRKTTWTLAYTEDVTTSQGLLFLPIENVEDPFGGDEFSGFTLGFTDRVFLNKTLRGNVGYALKRGRISVGLTQTIREFEDGGASDDLVSLTTGYTHTLSRSTTATGDIAYRVADSGDSSADEQAFTTYRVSLTHTISRYINSSLEFSHSGGNRGVGGEDFSENRAIARLSVRF